MVIPRVFFSPCLLVGSPLLAPLLVASEIMLLPASNHVWYGMIRDCPPWLLLLIYHRKLRKVGPLLAGAVRGWSGDITIVLGLHIPINWGFLRWASEILHQVRMVETQNHGMFRCFPPLKKLVMNGFRWPIHSSHSDIGETANRPKFPACWIKSWAMRLGYVMTRWGHVLQRSGSFHSHWGTPSSLDGFFHGKSY